MSMIKTAVGIAGGVMLGLIALIIVLFVGCAGLIAVGQQAQRADQVIEGPSGEALSRIEIVSVDASAIENSSFFTKYAYILTVRNNGNTPRTHDFSIELLDAQGFVIDQDRLWGETLMPGETVLRGTILASGDKRNSVTSVNAKVR
jgi:hypothetical protein